MSLPTFAMAQLDRLTYVRFLLDHDRQQATMLNTGPSEAWGGTASDGVLAQIEPYAYIHNPDDLPGQTLRLMGHPFNTLVVYDIVRRSRSSAADPDSSAVHASSVPNEEVFGH